MAHSIVVIGGGPAAVWAAIEAKKRDPAATVTLVSEESCEPYEKPPLSKAVLLGKAQPKDAPIAGKGGVAAHGVTAKLGARCTAIDRATRSVETTAGPLPYDALVLAPGSLMRELAPLPPNMPRVHYLRTEAQARALRDDLAHARHLLVIGAGLIGLEVAASAAELGIKVTVLEVAPRIMARALDAETGALILAEHQRHGVEVRVGTSVAAAAAKADGIAITTSADDTIEADAVVVGAGVLPDERLAIAAGLTHNDGIMVDEQCRTSDANIFAAGDATRFPGPHGPVRLENWRHGQDHGVVAGRNAAGAAEPYRVVPSFWTEQYDLYVQGVGWPPVQADDLVRRDLGGKATLLLQVKDGVIAHAQGINAQRDLAAIRRLIERRVPVDPAALADPAQPFAAMLKARA
jgi:NADPH-dependent 2,4-dienoyl-CoA reductase/sulfur reductase-like enzyme